MSGFVTAGVVAERAGITERNVCLACQTGRLPAEKIDGKWMIRSHDAATFVAEKNEQRYAVSINRTPISFAKTIDAIVDAARSGRIQASTARAFVVSADPRAALAAHLTATESRP